MLENTHADLDFNDVWMTVRLQVLKLRVFTGGLATIYLGTTRVGGDCLVIGWDKIIYRIVLIDFTFKGVMPTEYSKHLQTYRAVLHL